MNWTKEKINKMAQITGLSQSQVYKWCWDQKKKNHKTRDDTQKSYFNRRKFIKKDLTSRNKYVKYDYQDIESLEEEVSNEEKYEIHTKLKPSQKIEQDIET